MFPLHHLSASPICSHPPVAVVGSFVAPWDQHQLLSSSRSQQHLSKDHSKPTREPMLFANMAGAAG